MPEALAVLFVFVVSAVVYVFAWVRARDPANHRPGEEFARLQLQRVWLEERLALATRENWSGEMKRSLSLQLEATIREADKVASNREA